MIAVVTEEMHKSDGVPDLENDYERAYGWKGNSIHQSEMASSRSAGRSVLEKCLTRADIVREAMLPSIRL
jgi:hypothetical protein